MVKRCPQERDLLEEFDHFARLTEYLIMALLRVWGGTAGR